MRPGLLLWLLIPAIAAGSGVADVNITNSIDAFLEFYDSSKGLSDQEKIEQFKSRVFPANPDFYEYLFEDWKHVGRNPDQELIKQLNKFEEYKDRFIAQRTTISDQLNSALDLFQEQFADFKFDPEIYLVHSLGLADGTRRMIGGQEKFIIGLDVIARFHESVNNTPFFHHELFHFYQSQHYTQTEALYSHLWTEGLATYVSRALNPKATMNELMLAYGNYSIPEQTDQVLDQVANDLLENLDSTDWDVHMKYFAMSSKDPVIPQKAGYYIGYRFAKSLADEYSLSQLARLQDSEIASKLTAYLEQIIEG